MDSKWISMNLFLARKIGFKIIFSLILLSERNMGIDYIYNILDHENPLLSILYYSWTMMFWYKKWFQAN